MLSRKNYIVLGVQAFAAIGLLSSCVITETPTGTSTGEGGRSPTTAAVGTGGEGGEGGSGGSGVGGGATTSTGTGGNACVGETGAGVVDDCDHLNITPPSHGGGASAICGPGLNEEPPGYALCTHGFAIFNKGAATTLVTCLKTIGVQDSCKEAPLVACIDKMYDSECEIPAIKEACGDIKTSCAGFPFDEVQCAKDLNPLSGDGVIAFGKCMDNADPTLSCQQAYDTCQVEVLNP